MYTEQEIKQFLTYLLQCGAIDVSQMNQILIKLSSYLLK